MMPLALSRRSLESWGWFLLFCFTSRSLLWSDRTPINWLSSGAHLPPFSWVSLTLYCPQFWHNEELYKHMRSSKTKKTIQGNSKRQRGTRNTNSPMPLTVVWLGLCHIKLLLGTGNSAGINSQSLCFGNHFGSRKKRKKNEEVGIEVGKKRCKRWKEFEKKRRQ